VKPDDLIMSCSGTMGRVALVPEDVKPGIINQALLKLTPRSDLINPLFLKYVIESRVFQNQLTQGATGVAIQNVASVQEIKGFKIPLPPLAIQEKIIEELKSEAESVQGFSRLKSKMESQIKEVIDGVWGKAK